MSSRIHTATRHRLTLLLVTVAVAFATLFAPAAPAIAHDELLSTDPADGATLDALPAQLTLTFSGTVSADLGGNQVMVTDGAGMSLADGDPVVTDNIMTQPLTGDASGVVTVAWRIVSADGHPVTGQFAFTVAEAGSASPGPQSTPAPSATAFPTPRAAPAASQQASPVPWIVLGAAVIAAAGGVVYLLVSRGRRPPAGPHPDR